MSNRLSAFFDRHLRSSKSTSSLSSSLDAPTQKQSKRSQESGQHLSVGQEFSFQKGIPTVAPATTTRRPQSRGSCSSIQAKRVSRTPHLHPPDELLLKVIRRRSADARLEEANKHIQWQRSSEESELAMRLAVASALPPQFLEQTSYPQFGNDYDLCPNRHRSGHRQELDANRHFYAPLLYTSRDEIWSHRLRPVQSSPEHSYGRNPNEAVVYKPYRPNKHQSMKDRSLSDDLSIQTDETVTQYDSIKFTAPTPIMSSGKIEATSLLFGDENRSHRKGPHKERQN